LHPEVIIPGPGSFVAHSSEQAQVDVREAFLRCFTDIIVAAHYGQQLHRAGHILAAHMFAASKLQARNALIH
jgi:hypothetical protein